MRFEWDGQAVHELADLVVYQSIVQSGPADGKTLTGIEYVMIDPRFRELTPSFNGPIVVAMGGSDPRGLTDSATEAAGIFGCGVRVVIGPAARQPLARHNGEQHLVGPANMLQAFASASVYLGAMGMMAYEAMAAGVPCVLTNWSGSHEETAIELERAGAAINLGTWERFSVKAARRAVALALQSHERWEAMSEAGRALVDGGGVGRVADRILEVAR